VSSKLIRPASNAASQRAESNKPSWTSRRSASLSQSYHGTICDARKSARSVKRSFYIDIRKALDPAGDREESIIGVPEDRVIRTDFEREAVMDLSSPDQDMQRSCTRSQRCSTETNGRTASIATGKAIRMRRSARNSARSSAKSLRISNTIAWPVIALIELPRRKPLDATAHGIRR